MAAAASGSTTCCSTSTRCTGSPRSRRNSARRSPAPSCSRFRRCTPTNITPTRPTSCRRSPDIDTLLLYDTAGVLDKERLKRSCPPSKPKARGKPIEFHANNILGQSAKAYLDAIDLGVTILHTASRPMANGPSVPSTEIMLHNIELLGHTHGDRQIAVAARRRAFRARRQGRRLSRQPGTTNMTCCRSAIKFRAA